MEFRNALVPTTATKVLVFGCLILGCGNVARAGVIVENLSVVFTHGSGVNPTTNVDYLTATFTDTGTNAVQLTLTSNLGNQGYSLPDYYVGNFWLEYVSASSGYTASSDLSVSQVSGATPVVTLHNAGGVKADSKNKYDFFNLAFSTSSFGSNGTAVFNITAKGGYRCRARCISFSLARRAGAMEPFPVTRPLPRSSTIPVLAKTIRTPFSLALRCRSRLLYREWGELAVVGSFAGAWRVRRFARAQHLPQTVILRQTKPRYAWPACRPGPSCA